MFAAYRVRYRWALCCALLVSVLRAEPALLPTAGPDPADLPAASVGAGLWIQPYLQAVTADSAILRCETRGAQALQVTLTPGNVTLTDTAVRLHAVRAVGLTPETTYRLTVSAAGQELGAATVTTWPRDPRTIKFFAYGDTRTRPAEHAKICAAMAARAEGHLFVLHSGDLVANGKTYALWPKEFFGPASTLLARLPLYAVPGNHEGETGFFVDYFSLPEPRWNWWFEVGPVHVLGIDNFRGLSGAAWRESESGKWLQAELPRAKAPWRLAMFHVPIYSLGGHGTLDDEGEPKEATMRWCRSALEPLLRQHGYTVTINGHDHLYERSFKDGLVMLTSGGGGAPLYKPKDAKQNPWSQKVISSTHFMDITASPTTLDVTVLDGDGQTLDAFALTRDGAGKAVVSVK